MYNGNGWKLFNKNSKPVEKIEISRDHLILRIIITIAAFLIGIAAITYFIMALLKGDSTGWKEIEVSSDIPVGNSSEFVFLYDISSKSEGRLSGERNVTVAYSDAMKMCYWDLQEDEEREEVTNVATINNHPNEILTVDQFLYDSLKKMVDEGGRYLYYGPLYEEYNGLYFAENDEEARLFDQLCDSDEKSYFDTVLDFTKSEEHISLELMPENQVMLKVSDEYLKFKDEMEFKHFIDFSFFKNAFIIDEIARELKEQGFCVGSISSYDGFMVSLGEIEQPYQFPIWNRVEQDVSKESVLKCTKELNVVFYHDYPLHNMDNTRFYEYQNGEMRFAYYDEKDMKSKSSVHNLIVLSNERTCADMFLETISVYANDVFDKNKLDACKQENIFSIYFEGSEMKSNIEYDWVSYQNE